MVKGMRFEKLIGMAGEFYTAFQLTMLGIECGLVKQDGTDIVAVKCVNGSLITPQRIEVKTATVFDKKSLFNFQISKGGEKRPYTKVDCDIIALCSITQKSVLFFNVEKFQHKITKKIHVNDFLRDEDVKRSWDQSLYESQKHMRIALNKEKNK